MHAKKRSPGRLCGGVKPLVLLLLAAIVAPGQQKPNASFATLQKRAETAAAENRLDDAARLYTRALAMRPQWADGWWSLGTLEYDRDHYAKAAYAFQRLLALQPSNGTAHAMLGLCQFELGQDAPSLKHLLSAERFGIVKNEDLRKVALYHLGVLQLRARRFGDAQETLRTLAKERIRTPELITALGEAALLISSRDPQSQSPETVQIVERVGQAEALSAAGEFAPAKQIYTELTGKVPDEPNLHFAYGRMLLEAHETEPAIEQFRRELDLDPKNVNSMLEIASVRYQVDSEDGLKYAEQAVKLAPQMPFAHYLVGMLRLDTGDAAGAIPELEVAQKAFPKQPKVYFALGNAYARVGRKNDAARARAQFRTLEAQSAGQPGANVYGEQPIGIPGGQLQTEDGGKQPR